MPSLLRVTSVLVLLCLSATASDPYAFLWWAHGWRGLSPDGPKILHIQTSQYAAAFDVEGMAVPHLGPLPSAAPYSEAASESNDIVTSRPPASLHLAATVNGVAYECTAAASNQDDKPNFPVRIIESGRFLQRFDILNLTFTASDGSALHADARFEVIAWPDRLYLLCEITPADDWSQASLAIQLRQGDGVLEDQRNWLPSGSHVPLTVSVGWTPNTGPVIDPPLARASVADARNASSLYDIVFDRHRGWFYVDLPEQQWNIADDPDRLDRFAIQLVNTTAAPMDFRLLFAFDSAPFSGITGMCPMLRDAQGHPTGIPVQISKNWHRLPDRSFLYEGPWFHGVTIITVPAGERWTGELAIAYARWGGLPAASHAQLCLIGWGVNQLWDQAAIGSWGESICYDPDVNLNRSMIDDIRPLMVTGMRNGQWEWTHNVGGGDFLVYFNQENQKQYLTCVRTAYLASGPNLTETIYAGVSADGSIAMSAHVSTPRCDDVNRAYHRLRYDILTPVSFSRLAFYQLGADHYNDHQFTAMARGNDEGLIEGWDPGRGGKQYLRSPFPCEGSNPWFSLHGGIRTPSFTEGAWANRGMVIRSWKARLHGQDIPTPYAAVYGTENGVPSANLELVPPPGVNQLLPGDYVEVEVELLITPIRAEDYYGPNQPLREHLTAYPDSWQTVYRLAHANGMTVAMHTGTLLRTYPISVAVDENQSAEFTITGGLGYMPVTITGLQQPAGYVFECEEAPLTQQAVYGNDYWQTTRDPVSGLYAQTYNLRLDATEGETAVRHCQFDLIRGQTTN